MIGNPKFKYGDVVKFNLQLFSTAPVRELEGRVAIIDKYGTFEQNEEPSYDIYCPEMNALFKHIRESGLTLVREGTSDDLKVLEKI